MVKILTDADAGENAIILSEKVIPGVQSTPIIITQIENDLSQDENAEYDECYGCTHSFGLPNADEYTKKLYQILIDNLLTMDENRLIALISGKHAEIVVANDKTKKGWSRKSVRRHLTKCMLHSEYQLVNSLRMIQKIEERTSNCVLFEKGDGNDTYTICDPKAVKCFIDLTTKKLNMYDSIKRIKKT